MQASCGTGLAEHAVIPARLGRWTAAFADVLEAHTAALDPEDPLAKTEVEAYLRLANRFRELASELDATAAEMRDDRSLPPAEHDRDVLAGEQAREAFRSYVERERELHALLRSELARDEKVLRQLITASDT
jgi:hypothetical protein